VYSDFGIFGIIPLFWNQCICKWVWGKGQIDERIFGFALYPSWWWQTSEAQIVDSRRFISSKLSWIYHTWSVGIVEQFDAIST